MPEKIINCGNCNRLFRTEFGGVVDLLCPKCRVKDSEMKSELANRDGPESVSNLCFRCGGQLPADSSFCESCQDKPKSPSFLDWGYDSTRDTCAHKKKVGEILSQMVAELVDRAAQHDNSKLMEPEKTIFDEMTPKLKNSTYGSPEYKEFLEHMGKALWHHYECNRHHPECFPKGIEGMHLVDLLEMMADWAAAASRHDDGDIVASVIHNTARFGIEPQLAKILMNTALRFRG